MYIYPLPKYEEGGEMMTRYENYISKVMCTNCRYRGRIKIPVGKAIEAMLCPKCGLKELHHPSYLGIKEG